MLGKKHSAGVLNVTVIEARKLHGEDLVGKNDPYIELWIDEDYKQKTTVVNNTNSPVWNQSFTFNLSESKDHKLYIKVLDKDTIGSDKIGEAKVKLNDFGVFEGNIFEQWVKLPAKLGLTSHGEVHLYIQFVRTG